MTEPRRFIGEYKTSVVPDGLLALQASVYARAIMEQYKDCLPLPAGEYTLAPYVEADAVYTMEWWQKFHGSPVLINKLRTKDNQIVYLNDMIRPETLAKMTRPLR